MFRSRAQWGNVFLRGGKPATVTFYSILFCAVFSLPVEALFPRMAFRFCILVHPYPL